MTAEQRERGSLRSVTPMGRYRLRGSMAPMSGAPVNWNARAVVWRGYDRRYWLRQGIRFLVVLVRDHPSGKYPPTRADSLRYRMTRWLTRVVDDRQFGPSHFTAVQGWLRSVVNTEADMEARKAWALTMRYWHKQEDRRAS